jgi:hypothetical protein
MPRNKLSTTEETVTTPARETAKALGVSTEAHEKLAMVKLAGSVATRVPTIVPMATSSLTVIESVSIVGDNGFYTNASSTQSSKI